MVQMSVALVGSSGQKGVASTSSVAVSAAGSSIEVGKWTRAAAVARSGRDEAYERDLFAVVDIEGKGRGVRYMGKDPIPEGVDILEYTGRRRGGGKAGGKAGKEGAGGRVQGKVGEERRSLGGQTVKERAKGKIAALDFTGGDDTSEDDDDDGDEDASNESEYAYKLKSGGEIDGRTGGITRLLNHGFYAEDINCRMHEVGDRVFCRTTRSVVRGEELTYYYSDEFDAQLRKKVGYNWPQEYVQGPVALEKTCYKAVRIAREREATCYDLMGCYK